MHNVRGRVCITSGRRGRGSAVSALSTEGAGCAGDAFAAYLIAGCLRIGTVCVEALGVQLSICVAKSEAKLPVKAARIIELRAGADAAGTFSGFPGNSQGAGGTYVHADMTGAVSFVTAELLLHRRAGVND